MCSIQLGGTACNEYIDGAMVIYYQYMAIKYIITGELCNCLIRISSLDEGESEIFVYQ